tara:strand:+ start:1108 stop:1398 length:291 start_codon:yes stop_codon:yes gene_type:complete
MVQPVKKEIFPIIFIASIVLASLMLIYLIKVNISLRKAIVGIEPSNQAQIEKIVESEHKKARQEFQEKYSQDVQKYQETYQELKKQKNLQKELQTQ